MTLLRSAVTASRIACSSRPLANGLSPRSVLRASPSLVRLLSNEARAKIDAAVKKDPLVIFMKGTPEMPMCGFSRAVCQVMEVQGVKKDKMQTYNCLEDEELRQGIKEYSEWPTIPQVYLNGEFIGGCDIMLSMHQSGELESALDKAGVLMPLQSQPSADAKSA